MFIQILLINADVKMSYKYILNLYSPIYWTEDKESIDEI